MCHVSSVTCHVSPVTFHLSPVITRTATATDPPICIMSRGQNTSTALAHSCTIRESARGLLRQPRGEVVECYQHGTAPSTGSFTGQYRPQKVMYNLQWFLSLSLFLENNPAHRQNVTRTEMSQKLKCHQNWNDTKTEMSPKLKCHQKIFVT